MLDRSGINLNAFATFGENVGSGTTIYKGKCDVNTLQFKSIAVEGNNGMSILGDNDNIIISSIPSFLSNNFKIIDSGDTSKGLRFVTSGITSSIFRTLAAPDKDGVIALISDIRENPSLQLIDEIGGQQVNNITPTAIQWTTEMFSGNSLNYTGGSRIYIEETDVYDISYALNVNNDTSSNKNIGTIIRKNGNINIETMSVASINLNLDNNSSTNTMPMYSINLNAGDYIELIAFRIGFDGAVYTKENGSWIRIRKNIKQ